MGKVLDRLCKRDLTGRFEQESILSMLHNFGQAPCAAAITGLPYENPRLPPARTARDWWRERPRNGTSDSAPRGPRRSRRTRRSRHLAANGRCDGALPPDVPAHRSPTRRFSAGCASDCAARPEKELLSLPGIDAADHQQPYPIIPAKLLRACRRTRNAVVDDSAGQANGKPGCLRVIHDLHTRQPDQHAKEGKLLAPGDFPDMQNSACAARGQRACQQGRRTDQGVHIDHIGATEAMQKAPGSSQQPAANVRGLRSGFFSGNLRIRSAPSHRPLKYEPPMAHAREE